MGSGPFRQEVTIVQRVPAPSSGDLSSVAKKRSYPSKADMMVPDTSHAALEHDDPRHLSRVVFFVFLVTFVLARITVFLIMARRIPDIYLHFGETHVHHLNYGIFLLSGIGAYLLYRRPAGRALSLAAAIYGVGLALTFDEFGMWLHLGGSYWQRASFDGVSVVTALLGLVAFAPPVRRFRPGHWWTAAVAVVLTVVFFVLLKDSLRFAEDLAEPRLQRLELGRPQ